MIITTTLLYALVTAYLRLPFTIKPTSNKPYLAPINGLGGPDIIKDAWIVHFHKDHTFKQHINHVGEDVSTWPEYRSKEYLPGYSASFNKSMLDEHVRTDPGVLLIETNLRVYAPEINQWQSESCPSALIPYNVTEVRCEKTGTEQFLEWLWTDYTAREVCGEPRTFVVNVREFDKDCVRPL